jgi:CubicO group peptidase (beta-lactamase class C family)
MLRKHNVSLVVVAFFLSLQSAAQENTSVHEKQIDEIIRTTGIVGVGAVMIVNKEVVWTKGFGYADRENKTPFTTSTVMNIASISKTFTGACIMKAAEEGKLSLDTDINEYLPFKVFNPNFPNEKITLRQLATHTSGLADRYPFYSDSLYYYEGQKPEPLGVFLKSYFSPEGKHYSNDNFVKAKPGTYREYSNIAAGLAGYIVELRTGKSLNEFASENIFRPLKMNHTTWSLSEVDLTTHTKLYEKRGDRIERIPLYEMTTYPDGGVRTSASDLSKFFIALLNGGKYNGIRILSEQSVAEMLRLQFSNSYKPANINLTELNSGIFWATKMDVTRIGHNGSDPGVRTFMLADLPKEIGIILFFNTSLTDAEETNFFEIYKLLYNYAAALKAK